MNFDNDFTRGLVANVSKRAQPIEPEELAMVEAELNRLGVKTLGGHALPLDPEDAARLLARVVQRQERNR